MLLAYSGSFLTRWKAIALVSLACLVSRCWTKPSQFDANDVDDGLKLLFGRVTYVSREIDKYVTSD